MDEPVVTPAQEHEVGQRGHASAGPVDDVMCVAPRRRPVARGEATMPVAHDHRPAHRAGDHRGAPADVQRLRPTPGDHPADRGVARQPPEQLGMDRPDVIELGPVAGVPLEGPHVHDHRDVRTFARGVRPP